MNAPDPTLTGNIKATRDDWLRLAIDVLVEKGVERVKILPLAEALGVSRSSFYWYFKDRRELLDALLETWERSNTGVFQRHCEMPSATIAEAVLNLFLSFLPKGGFNHRLDFAVREWSRRSPEVRAVVDRADEARLAAIAAMYARHRFAPEAAQMRARILYYMQIGYYALELNEPLAQRLERVPGYVEGFTGVAPGEAEMAAFRRQVEEVENGTDG